MRKAHSFTMVNRMLSGRIPRSTTGRNSVISTWQSWDLRFVNFFSVKFKIPFILDEYSDGTFILFKQSNMSSFCSSKHVFFLFQQVYLAGLPLRTFRARDLNRSTMIFKLVWTQLHFQYGTKFASLQYCYSTREFGPAHSSPWAVTTPTATG